MGQTKEGPKIEVYSTSWCGDCKRSKAYLDRMGVGYIDIDIEQDEVAMKRVLELNGGMRSVPTIVFPDGSVLVEPSNQELGEKLA